MKKYLKNKIYYLSSIVLIAIIIVIGIIYIFNKPKTVEATWWNDTWSYRQSITVTNGSGSELTDFQVEILQNVDLSSLSPSKLQANLADLRFTDINHRVLPYWIEDSTISSVNAWIKIPSIPTTGTTIYMYYGNANATDDQSGDHTFEFFDDFDGVDTGKWIYSGSGYSFASGLITITGSDYEPLISAQTFSNDGLIVRAKIKQNSSGDFDSGYYLDYDASNTGIIHVLDSSAGGGNCGIIYPSWATEPASYTGLIGIDTWEITEMWRNGTTVYASAFGEQISSTIDANYTGPIALFTDTDNPSYTASYDYILIRKFASTAPVIGAPSTEENSPGPVGYWNFNEGFGTTAYDSTGYGNDGTLGGSAAWVQNGVKGRALDFPGNSNVNLGNDTSLALTSEFTLSAWVKYHTLDSRINTVIEKGSESANLLYWLAFDNRTGSEPSNLMVELGNGSTRASLYENWSPNANQWYHLAFTFDNGTGVMYVDGRAYGSPKAYGFASVDTSTYNAYIGAYTGASHYANSLIDEVYVYDRALSTNEILQLYNMNAGSFSTGRSTLPTSCLDQLSQNPASSSGVYTIDPGPGVDPFDVYCDMETDGGGWTLVHVATNTDATNIALRTTFNNPPAQFKDISQATIGEDYFSQAYIDVPADDLMLVVQRNSYALFDVSDAYASYFNGIFSGYTNWRDLYIQNPSYGPLTTGINPTTGTAVPGRGKGPCDIWEWNNGCGGDDDNYISFLPYNSNPSTSGCGDYMMYTFSNDNTEHFGIPILDSGGAIEEDDTQWFSPACQPLSTNGEGAWGWESTGAGDRKFWIQMWTREGNLSTKSGIALDLPFENVSGSTTYDVSGNTKNAAVTGATPKSSANCKVGRCYAFDGNDYMSVTYGNGLNPTTTLSTYMAWVKSNFPSESRMYMAQGTSTDNKRAYFGHVDGYWDMGIYTGAWTSPSVQVAADTNWHHMAIVFDGSYANLYIDGIYRFSKTYSSYTFNQNLAIGAYNPTGGSYWWHGNIDEVKVFERALTQREIMMEMNGGKHQPVLDIGFDEGGGDIAYDKSGFSNDANLYGSCPGAANCPTWNTPENCMSGSCMTFDGAAAPNGDYAVVGAVSTLRPNYVSIGAWAKINTIKSTQFIAGYGNTSDDGYWLGITGSDWAFSVGNSAGGYQQLSSEVMPAIGEWQHVFGTYDGSTQKIYVNGELKNTGTNTSGALGYDNLASGFLIGNVQGLSTDRFWDGSIDELKVYPYALTADEIKQEYIQSAGQFGRTNSVGDKTTPGASCMDILHKNPKAASGRYWVDPSGGSLSDSLEVYCDMEHDGGGWTLLGLEFAYVNSTWLPYTTYGDISTNGANTTNLITSGTGSNYMYMQKVMASDYTFNEFWTGKLNTANIMDKDPGAQIQITLSGQSWPPNAKTGATNVYVNTWCSSWRYGDATNGFELWLGEASACGAYSATTGNIPRRIYKSGSKLSWNGNADTGTSTDNNFGYLFGRNSSVTPNNTAPLLDLDLDQYVGGVYLERSGNNITGTPNGDPQWKSTVNCKSGRCVEFDSNDYINWGGSIDNGTTTVVAWFNSSYSDKQALFNFRNGDAQGGFYFDYQQEWPLLYLAGENYRYWANSSAYMDGSWHFLELYIPGSAQSDITNTVLRIDNTVISAGTTSSSVGQAAWTNFFISDNDYGFRGVVDEMKVYNRALTRAEVAQLYNGGKPVGWWRLDEGVDNLCSDGKDACDNTEEGNNGTISGDPTWITDTSSCKQGWCMDFDGTGDKLTITDPSSGILDFGSEDFSVATWVYYDGYINNGSGWNAFLSKAVLTGPPTSFYGLYTQATNKAYFVVNDDGYNVASTSTINSAWHHVTGVREGNTIKIYIDGVLEGTSSTSGSVSSTSALTIGDDGGGNRYLNGKLDDIRIYNYALTDKQVKEVYNQGLIHFK
ncbi:MAG: DUF2341 domain-containing protein [Candidatus Komeilibacteria bacterium]